MRQARLVVLLACSLVLLLSQLTASNYYFIGDFQAGSQENLTERQDTSRTEVTTHTRHSSTAQANDSFGLANWKKRLHAKQGAVSSGNVTLFFAHLRKSGGTSLTSLLSSNFPNGFAREAKPHLNAVASTCLLDQTFAKETLFLTSLRHPLERWNSEFNYLGFPRRYGLMSPPETESRVLPAIVNFTNGYSVLNGAACKPKLDENGKCRGVKLSSSLNCYVDNYLTRYFSGACACNDLSNHEWTGTRYWDAGCKHDARCEIDRADFERAKEVLTRFDLIMVQDKKHGTGSTCGLNSIIEAVGGVGISASLRSSTQLNKKAKRVDLTIYPKVVELLESTNKYDMLLWEFASELYKRRLSAFCNNQ